MSDPTEVCEACGEPATRQDVEGVWLCEDDYQRMRDHWLTEEAATTPFTHVRAIAGGSVCSVLVDGVEIARATYDKKASIIQCRREGVPSDAATTLRRIARELSA